MHLPFFLASLVPLLATTFAALPEPRSLPVTEPSRGGVGAKKFATTLDCGAVVAFSSVGASAGEKSGSATKVLFARDLTDKGIGWSREDGEFTCYCPGLYQFAFAGSNLALKKKASHSDAWTTVVATSSSAQANVALLDMEVGDKAAIWSAGQLQQEQSESPVTSFSGFRIAKK